MPTIFTRAIAARKVMSLLDDKWGIPSSSLTSCKAQLESDLGMPNDAIYDVLEAMATELHVDMSQFDCEDYITRESLAAWFVWFVLLIACPALVVIAFPSAPPAVGFPLSVLLIISIYWIFVRLVAKPHPELRLDDLIKSVEARRWISPKL